MTISNNIFTAATDRDNLTALIFGADTTAQDAKTAARPGLFDLQIQDLNDPTGGLVNASLCI